jgi:phthiocerol/phenolphthiocerol synthesis type-I polyketide synthase C
LINQFIQSEKQDKSNGKRRPLHTGPVRDDFAQGSSSPVAIIGLAFRFPGDLSEEAAFWNALKHKRDLVTQVPDDRWAVGEAQHEKRSEPGRSVTFSAGVLSRIDEFDAGFFGISPREAAWLDPQQRLLLELSWEAMENAGVPPSGLSGTDCAVYVGISSLDYGMRGLDDLASMSSHMMTGNTMSIAANRLSYVFDLHGPSLAIDTACSSSLVALHHACRALQTDEANTALVGGVNLLLHPYPFVGFTKASMLSADGRCKAFDASGNGYVRAEGGAVLLLKRFDRAIADGDDIQAVILATGANADGARKTGITIPSRDGQAELMKGVLAKTGLSTRDIDFVEAHGTGTAVGDPIETAAIGEVYGHGREKPLPIGSVKANLGHMEAASGMAGLVKTIQALQHRALPPQIHLETPNPHIDFADLNLQPVTEYRVLEKDGPLVAGVNSFGFGGANAHVLLQEYRKKDTDARLPVPENLPPLILSARSDAALRALAERYAVLLSEKTPQDYYDIAYAAVHLRDRLEKRLALAVTTSAETMERLAAFAQGDVPAGIVFEEALPQQGGIVFVYSGNGAQWVGMGQRLLAESARFAEMLADLDERMHPVAGFSLLAELQAEDDASRLDDTVIAQPLLFAIQVAITLLLKEQGIEPAAVAGHSVGEVAAAWASGALDLDAAIRVIVGRSRAQGETRGAGRMAAVGLSAVAMQAVLIDLGGELDVTIAGINSPNNITLSGSLGDLEHVQAHLACKGTFFRLLDLDHAFHGRTMDPIRETLLVNLTGLESRSSDRTAFVSTVTGDVLAGDQLGPEYWWRNVREPVRFVDAMTTLASLGCRVFVEIGPHAILQRYIGECLAGAEAKGRVLPTLRKESDGWDRIVETALRAHLLAEKPNLSIFFPQPGRHVRLPNYAWQRERHWHPRSSESLLAIERRRVHPLLGWKIPEAEHSWENILDPVVLPWLTDHKVGGAIVFPGAAYAEMALAAAREWLAGERLACEDLDIVAPMVFDGEHSRTVRLDLNGRDGGFQIKSRQRLSADEWTLHAAGRILQPGAGSSDSRIPSLTAATKIDRETHYRLAATLGLDYGPIFQGLYEADLAESSLDAKLEWPANLIADDYLIHPALLDVCYQSLVGFFRSEIEAGQGVALLPVRTGRLAHHRSGTVSQFRARLNRRSARSVLADFELFDSEDNLLASVSACRFRAAPLVHKEQEQIARWRLDPWLRPHPSEGLFTELPSSQELVEQIRTGMEWQDAQRRTWFKEALPLFEALVVSFAFEACRAMSPEDALHRLVTSTDPYTRWLIGLLRQEGLMFEQDGRWSLAEDNNPPAAEEIWRTLEREHGASLPQLVLLGRVGRNLARLMLNESERREFLNVLWLTPAAETLYDEDPAYSGIRQTIEYILHRLANDLPRHRRLRVLELAAGPSEVPRALLAALPEDRLDYVLALPEAAAERQQAEYAPHHNLTIATLDRANWQLPADRRLPETFDVVIVRHVLHRAASPKAALNQARRWLATGGCLLIAERHPDWSTDFLAGLDADWWHESVAGDAPLSSLLPPAAWTEALKTEGFEDVREFSEPAADGLSEGAYLILAQCPEQSATELPPLESAAWLLLADSASAELTGHLSIRLESLGQRVETTEWLAGQNLADFRHVVHLRGWNGTPETSVSLLTEALGDVQTVAAHSGKSPRLWFIARGGALASELPVSPASRAPNPAQAALWGFGRVVMNEHPALDCTLIDLACDPLAADTLNRLENELLRPDGANEVVLADSGRYTLVLREEADHVATPATEGERFRLDFHLPGQLRNLAWLRQEERSQETGKAAPSVSWPLEGTNEQSEFLVVGSLREDEVEVRVQATGLNFRDVMYLMGLLPDEAVEKGFAGASLGLEFAGIVSRVGPRVADLREGDRVMGFGSACFASHVVTRADAVALMPDQWSFESAATVPTVFFTAYYALKHLADLQPNERVLIHGGAGGGGYRRHSAGQTSRRGSVRHGRQRREARFRAAARRRPRLQFAQSRLCR